MRLVAQCPHHQNKTIIIVRIVKIIKRIGKGEELKKKKEEMSKKEAKRS